MADFPITGLGSALAQGLSQFSAALQAGNERAIQAKEKGEEFLLKVMFAKSEKEAEMAAERFKQNREDARKTREENIEISKFFATPRKGGLSSLLGGDGGGGRPQGDGKFVRDILGKVVTGQIGLAGLKALGPSLGLAKGDPESEILGKLLTFAETLEGQEGGGGGGGDLFSQLARINLAQQGGLIDKASAQQMTRKLLTSSLAGGQAGGQVPTVSQGFIGPQLQDAGVVGESERKEFPIPNPNKRLNKLIKKGAITRKELKEEFPEVYGLVAKKKEKSPFAPAFDIREILSGAGAGLGRTFEATGIPLGLESLRSLFEPDIRSQLLNQGLSEEEILSIPRPSVLPEPSPGVLGKISRHPLFEVLSDPFVELLSQQPEQIRVPPRFESRLRDLLP